LSFAWANLDNLDSAGKTDPVNLRSQKSRGDFENLHVYRLAEKLADEIWKVVSDGDSFAKATVGRQIVRAADSVGANITEGLGRGTYLDNRRFVRTARGSLNETKHWLRCAYRRHLLPLAVVDKVKPLIDELGPRLNAYLNSIGRIPGAGSAPDTGTSTSQQTSD